MPDFRRSNISRQFTDAEAALDERITSHLTAPPLQFDTSAGNELGYKWLSDDLALRSTLSQQLAGEQAMAYAQSERRALADQAIEQEEQDTEALSGIKRVREMLASGEAKDPNDAIYRASGENERLGINPVFGKMAADLGRTFENPQQRELRQRKADLELAKLHNDKFIVDAQGMTNEAIGTVAAANRNVERFQQEGVTAANNAIYEESRGIVVRDALRQSKEAKAVFDAIGDPKNRTARIRAQGMLGKLGLSDVADVEGMAKIASQDELTLGALMDVTGRNEILDTPEKQALYVEQWNTLSAADPNSPEYRKALSGIDAVTAAWDERNQSHLKQAKADTVLGEVSKDFNEPWADAAKAIDAIYRDKDLGKSNKGAKPAAMLNRYVGFLSQFTGQGHDELVKKATSLVAGKLKASGGKESKFTAEEANAFISGLNLEFGTAFKNARASAKLDPSAKKGPSAAMRPAPYGTPYTKDGKTYDWDGSHYRSR